MYTSTWYVRNYVRNYVRIVFQVFWSLEESNVQTYPVYIQFMDDCPIQDNLW